MAEAIAAETARKGMPSWLKMVLVVVVIGAVLAAGSVFDFQERLHGLLHTIEGLGGPGYAVFLVAYVVACVFLLPGSILTLGAGAIYGVVLGTIIASIASTIGAAAAFMVGRHLARDWVAQKIQGNAKFAAIDNAVGREGWKIVGLTRLSPVFPFSLLNYAYGLTKVKLRDYFFASWIGMLPGTLMYVYFGSLAKTLSAVATDCPDCERSALQWAIYALGLVATVAVTVVITRVARRALKEKVTE